MSTILIGVDASERSEDAIAFGAQCPVMIVPRGVEAPLGRLFAGRA